MERNTSGAALPLTILFTMGTMFSGAKTSLTPGFAASNSSATSENGPNCPHGTISSIVLAAAAPPSPLGFSDCWPQPASASKAPKAIRATHLSALLTVSSSFQEARYQGYMITISNYADRVRTEL